MAGVTRPRGGRRAGPDASVPPTLLRCRRWPRRGGRMPSNPSPPTPDAPAQAAWSTPRSARALVLLAITGIGLYLCFRLALPFLPALAWALALAVLFTPLQGWLEKHVRRPSLATSACLFVIAVIVVAPAVLIGQQLVEQVAIGAEVIDSEMARGDWRERIRAHPRLAPTLELIETNLALPDTVKSVTAWVSSTAATVVKGSLLQVVAVALTF